MKTLAIATLLALGATPAAAGGFSFDFGFGYQGFVELNWRTRQFVIGFDVKYQAVTDIFNIDYSNFRFGGHVGVVF